jgi:hypothetical protein
MTTREETERRDAMDAELTRGLQKVREELSEYFKDQFDALQEEVRQQVRQEIASERERDRDRDAERRREQDRHDRTVAIRLAPAQAPARIEEADDDSPLLAWLRTRQAMYAVIGAALVVAVFIAGLFAGRLWWPTRSASPSSARVIDTPPPASAAAATAPPAAAVTTPGDAAWAGIRASEQQWRDAFKNGDAKVTLLRLKPRATPAAAAAIDHYTQNQTTAPDELRLAIVIVQNLLNERTGSTLQLDGARPWLDNNVLSGQTGGQFEKYLNDTYLPRLGLIAEGTDTPLGILRRTQPPAVLLPSLVRAVAHDGLEPQP